MVAIVDSETGPEFGEKAAEHICGELSQHFATSRIQGPSRVVAKAIRASTNWRHGHTGRIASIKLSIPPQNSRLRQATDGGRCRFHVGPLLLRNAVG